MSGRDMDYLLRGFAFGVMFGSVLVDLLWVIYG